MSFTRSEIKLYSKHTVSFSEYKKLEFGWTENGVEVQVSSFRLSTLIFGYLTDVKVLIDEILVSNFHSSMCPFLIHDNFIWLKMSSAVKELIVTTCSDAFPSKEITFKNLTTLVEATSLEIGFSLNVFR